MARLEQGVLAPLSLNPPVLGVSQWGCLKMGESVQKGGSLEQIPLPTARPPQAQERQAAGPGSQRGFPAAFGGPAWLCTLVWNVPDSPVHGGSPWAYLARSIDGVHCIEYPGCGGQGQAVTDIPFRLGLYWLGERVALRDGTSYAQLREGSFTPYCRGTSRKPAWSVG